MEPLFEFSFPQLLLMILQIAVIDLVLSGDTAAVIGMAICRLPEKQRRQAAFWGAFLAVCLRVIFTLAASMLLEIPFISAAGGVVLLGITYKLLFPQHENESLATISAKSKLWQAVMVIIAADASMALDNVLGVAGAAEGMPILICFGLLLSVPILIWGSTAVGNLMARFPIVLWLGGAILVHTALNMIFHDHGLGFAAFTEKGELISLGAAATVILTGIIKIYSNKN
ncbi:MAG: TerC family protein [Firmicutes bacterium]|nr:TerC family protein [Bacillota bacterium]